MNNYFVRKNKVMLYKFKLLCLYRNLSEYHKMFVYGTLKKGQPNHFYIDSQVYGYSKFICPAVTTTKYPLIITTKFNIPFLLHKPGVGHFVKGEIYEIDDRKLKIIDELENHPETYQREEDMLKPLDYRRSDFPDLLKCWVYFFRNFKDDLLDLNMYESYDTAGSHGLDYVNHYNNDFVGEL